MKLKTVFVLSILLQFVSGEERRDFRPDSNENDNPFSISALTVEAVATDSVRTIIYLEIPNSSLQFVKNDSGFQADFEATISVKDRDDIQKGRFIWTRTVSIVDYRETISTTLATTLFAEFVLPTDELEIFAEVLDKDTHNTSRNQKELDLTAYNQEFFVFPIALLKKKPGNWGIGEDMIPVLNYRIPSENDNYYLLVSGKVQSGPFAVSVVAIDNADSVLLSNSLDYTNAGNPNVFSTRMHIPQEILRDLNIHFIIKLDQGEMSHSETMRLSIAHPGIPGTIQDIELAIDQLRYILNDDEYKKFKKASVEEKELLFKEFWADHDPTPNTVKNELMEEYFLRVRFANENFSTFLPGWRSDMGMIYILFGPPDEIERAYSSVSGSSGQAWHYYSINRSFIFIDTTGFGDYRLSSPYFGETIW